MVEINILPRSLLDLVLGVPDLGADFVSKFHYGLINRVGDLLYAVVDEIGESLDNHIGYDIRNRFGKSDRFYAHALHLGS